MLLNTINSIITYCPEYIDMLEFVRHGSPRVTLTPSQHFHTKRFIYFQITS